MQYALLIYTHPGNQDAERPMDSAIAAVLAKPNVTGWARLHAEESATTVRHGAIEAVLSDGPFIETKEYLAGLVMVEAGNLDEALVVAQELHETMTAGAIEVRPVREARFHGA